MSAMHTVCLWAAILTCIFACLQPVFIIANPVNDLAAEQLDSSLRDQERFYARAVAGIFSVWLPILGLEAILRKMPCLILAYAILMIINTVMWVGSALFLVADKKKTEYSSFKRQYGSKYIWVFVHLLFSIFQGALAGVCFSARKKIMEEQLREQNGYQPVCQPHQPPCQSPCPPNCQPMYQPQCQHPYQPQCQPLNQPMNQPVNQPESQPTSQPESQPANQPVPA
ncbi:hypothetical protein PMAYCL1PPCAC_28106 [Pristionchus mayeri]|uniref:Uncharacterized protein n=1 Tax=Pristionchus mayeri TaxID=1317129 RepID=A0AAN5D7P4_9BILA|nr:hypothetical protein PMAYCL1PPCAC_28106 [Pristionchus mayeri]